LGVGLLVLYALLVAPAGFVVARWFGPFSGWIPVTLAIVLAASSSLIIGQSRTGTFETVVEVRTLGVNGTVLTTAYHSRLDLDPDDPVPVRPGAVSTVFSGRPVFRSVGGRLDPLLVFRSDLGEPVTLGVGGGTVLAGPERPKVRLGSRPWEQHTLQTLTLDQGGPDLEATLSLIAGSDSTPGRVQGTVTNRGATPVRQFRAQLQEGQAELSKRLGPGETIQVDTPVVTPTSRVPGPGEATATAEEAAMYAAASRSFTGPGQIALVGLPHGEKLGATARPKGAGRHVSVIVTVVPLEASETVLAGSGGARLVASAPAPFGGSLTDGGLAVHDLSAPPGTGPLSIRYPALLDLPNFRTYPFTAQTYSWTTGKWRNLPPSGRAKNAFIDTPLDPAEVSNGLVRFRSQAKHPLAVPATAQLLLTRTSEEEAKRSEPAAARPPS